MDKAETARFFPRIGLGIVVGVLIITGNARAADDTLAEIQKRGTLIWGADQEGGGPFAFPDEKDPSKLRGFEVELADMLAAELGVKAVFQQGQWDNLPSLLERRTVDIALNGIERTPQRLERYRCSRPYYAYALQLLARCDGPIQEWEDLAKPNAVRPQVGVLTGSAAETYLKEKYPDTVEILSFDGSTNAMEKAAQGGISATLQDDCVSVFYADRFPELAFVGRPVGGGYYVVLCRKEDDRLQAAIDTALEKFIKDGRLQKLYDRWDLSGRFQNLALRNPTQIEPAAPAELRTILSANLPIMIESAWMTVKLSFLSMPLAMVIGLCVAVARMYGATPIRWLAALYIEVIRGTPLMLQLYALFFLLPKLGLTLPPMLAAVIGLAINYSAYEAEIYRAGLQSIPKGQWEAALSLGMTQSQTLRRIILPQALRVVIPPITNDFIALFKDTSVCSVVTVVELTKRYNVLAQSTGAIVELATMTALLYLLMSYPLSIFARWSEKKLQG